MRRRGFTIIELVITITIMAILLTLGVVSLSGTQKNARDSERKSDISTIALNLESYYLSGTDSSTISQDCTGGIISHDGIYTVHKYISSGAITCNGSVSSEVLIVAGGGGGGSSGGGGGGGVISASVDIAGGTSYLVNVGASGTAGSSTVQGGNGGNSSFASLISVGGGGGGKAASVGSAGGSGGGGGTNSAVGNTWAGGAGVEGQGYAGGTTTGLSCSPSGGGGGAGGIGSNSTSTSGGAGGIGIVSSISGTLTYYGGGGGGGAYCLSGGSGGIGGGGAGSNWDVGTSGTANTGGGGGGGATGGSGGSGIVIIRYLTPVVGSYPSTLITADSSTMTKALRDIDIKSLTAPGISDPTLSFIPATDNTETTPQPTIDQYIYQPLKQDGTLCVLASDHCQKFNLYYRLETDNTVYMVTSKNQ